MVLKGHTWHMVSCFALQTFVTVFTILFSSMDIDALSTQTIFSRTIHISNLILNWTLWLFKKFYPFVKQQQKRLWLHLKVNNSDLTQKRALRIFIIASAERVDTNCVRAKISRTRFFRTKHIPKEINNAIFEPTIRVKVLHIIIALKYSHLFAK